eukprot:7377082-Prymnesium_polylepis.1
MRGGAHDTLWRQIYDCVPSCGFGRYVLTRFGPFLVISVLTVPRLLWKRLAFGKINALQVLQVFLQQNKQNPTSHPTPTTDRVVHFDMLMHMQRTAQSHRRVQLA